MGTCSCRLSRQWLPPIGIFIANLVATERLVADGHERRAHRGYRYPQRCDWRKRATRGNWPWEVSHPKEEEVLTEVRTGRPLRVMGASRRHQRQLGRLGALCRLYG